MRRKRKLMLQWAIAAGLLVSIVLGCILYWIGAK
jgi:high-affinity Fe2+/Pb2+ permease